MNFSCWIMIQHNKCRWSNSCVTSVQPRSQHRVSTGSTSRYHQHHHHSWIYNNIVLFRWDTTRLLTSWAISSTVHQRFVRLGHLRHCPQAKDREKAKRKRRVVKVEESTSPLAKKKRRRRLKTDSTEISQYEEVSHTIPFFHLPQSILTFPGCPLFFDWPELLDRNLRGNCAYERVRAGERKLHWSREKIPVSQIQ